MRWYCCVTGLVLMLLSLTACGPLTALKGPPSDPLKVLGEATTQGRLPRLRMQPLAIGDETPYTPVMLPPDVRRAFVRGHTNAHRDLIGGHWWYVRIEDWSWPVEREERLTPFRAPSHVPLAPQLPSQGQKSDMSQQAPLTAPSYSATPFQQPFPHGTVRQGVVPPGGPPQFQLGPSSRTVPPAAPRLAPFYGDGPYAGFVDGPNAFELHEQLTVIELSQLWEAPDLQTVLMLVLMHHLTLYFAAPARRNRRKYMFNDEVWALMQHLVSARILVEMARTFRKLRTSAIFISQQGTDYAGPTGQAIKTNTSVAYFLQQDAGEIEMLRTLFDLTPAEADLLKTVHRRPRWSEAYLRIPEHKGGVVRIVPDPYLRLMATQDPVELAAREAALDATDGDLHAALCQLAHDDLLKKELL